MGQLERSTGSKWVKNIGQAIEFRTSYRTGPQQVDEVFEYLGPEVGDHKA